MFFACLKAVKQEDIFHSYSKAQVFFIAIINNQSFFKKKRFTMEMSKFVGRILIM